MMNERINDYVGLHKDFMELVEKYREDMDPKMFIFVIVSECAFLSRRSAPDMHSALSLFSEAVTKGWNTKGN